jgi:hypothetical protein
MAVFVTKNHDPEIVGEWQHKDPSGTSVRERSPLPWHGFAARLTGFGARQSGRPASARRVNAVCHGGIGVNLPGGKDDIMSGEHPLYGGCNEALQK